MTTQISPETRPHVAVINGTIKTTSIKVAEHFGKLHKDVLKAVNNLECSKEFHERNFAPMQIEVEIGNGAKRMSPAYEITRDGFTFLAMGFTGKEAAKWKEAYINAFNAMEAQLRNPPERKTKKALPGGLTLEQQDVIKAMVSARADRAPSDKKASVVIKTWSAIKAKFGVSYKEIPSEEFVNVVSLISRLPIEGELLPIDQPDPRNHSAAKALLDNLKQFVEVAVDEAMQETYIAELEKLEKCITRAWTEIDEALFRINNAAVFLNRWKSSM